MCSNFPTTTTFFGLSGDCCNKNCSKRFYLYTHKNKKKKIYSDKNRHRQPDCKLQPSFCTRFVHIFFNCFSLSILNLLKKSLVKKKNLPFIHLPYTRIPARECSTYCILLQDECSGKKLRKPPPEEKKFSLFIHKYKSHNRAHTHLHVEKVEEKSLSRLRSIGHRIRYYQSRVEKREEKKLKTCFKGTFANGKLGYFRRVQSIAARWRCKRWKFDVSRRSNRPQYFF